MSIKKIFSNTKENKTKKEKVKQVVKALMLAYFSVCVCARAHARAKLKHLRPMKIFSNTKENKTKKEKMKQVVKALMLAYFSLCVCAHAELKHLRPMAINFCRFLV